jgi:hypothetical protein
MECIIRFGGHLRLVYESEVMSTFFHDTYFDKGLYLLVKALSISRASLMGTFRSLFY